MTVCPVSALETVPIVRSTYCNPDHVVTSFPSAPASRNGMTAPFLIVSHSTTMIDDNRVKNCGAQDLLPTSGPAILIESFMNVLPSLVFFAGVRLGENDHTRCVAV